MSDTPEERRLKIAELKAELAALTKHERDAEAERERIRIAEADRLAAEAMRLKWAPFVGATIEAVTETGGWADRYILHIQTSAGTLDIPGSCYEGSYEEIDVEIKLKP